MIKSISIINLSTVISKADAVKMVTACNIQLSRDVAPAWGKSPIPVVLAQSTSTVPINSARIYIYDDSDQAGALGYHSRSGNLVWGTVFAKTIIDHGCPRLYNVAVKNSTTVSSVLSHEVIELFVNPYVNAWADGPTITEGSEYALEACDAVEADVYRISLTQGQGTVSVSNFLYPEYFNDDAAGTKLDHLNILKRPFTLSDYGYMIVRSSPGNETAIFGSKYPEILKEINKAK